MKLLQLLTGSLFCTALLSFCSQTGMKSVNDDKAKNNSSPLAGARQLVLVVTPDWNTISGKLWRFERESQEEGWRQTEPVAAIVVGRNGLAWGSGLHEQQPDNGPVKQEGDGRSPAGIFLLSSAFGYAGRDQAGLIRLPYTHLTGTIECVDDVSSGHYNSIVDRKVIPEPDWKSSEKMREQKEYYRWGVVVDHNAAPVVRRGGSCIFLHIWKDASSGTAGCTAMEATHMESLMRWLDPQKGPLLVQLPQSEYQRLQGQWQLPQPQ